MKLPGEGFERMEQQQRKIEELLSQITRDLMQRVGKHWIRRFNQTTSTHGDEVER
jgi:hypothetical protein